MNGGATTQDGRIEPTGRIVTLDVLRGVAVMGILAMNIVAFAMPYEAYVNPRAFGLESEADLASWVLSFVLVDGKMRGLFSFLFGASMLLVIERAEAAGEPSTPVHFARMLWLLIFGLLHFYFIWFGDILTLYAMVGMIAWFFRRQPPESLFGLGITLVIVQLFVFILLAVMAHQAAAAAAAPGASAAAFDHWRAFSDDMAIPSGEELAETLALYRGDYAGIVAHRLGDELLDPIVALVLYGWETLGYMLLGMAMLKSGFLGGGWDAPRYLRIAAGGLAVAVPVYAFLAWALLRAGFSVPAIYALSIAATTPVRPIMVIAIAALVILLARPGGWMVRRIAAAGRAAFTNYLGASLLMTGLFYGYGLGLYGRLSRAELWLIVVAAWLLMLLWSKPWLDRFLYGPFEWLWRSLSRFQTQPMVRTVSESP